MACFAMVCLTAVVWARALYERITEVRSRQLPAQALATSRDSSRVLRNTQALDNFANLFELPVLFYVLCLALEVTHSSTAGYAMAAWVFVALRAGHSVVHVTYNRVLHRFAIWLMGALWLFGMWGYFAFERLASRAKLPHTVCPFH